MQKKLLTLLLPALVISFNSSVSVAKDNYPASDFKPTVVYVDKDYKHTGSSSTVTRQKSKPDAKFPAANFEPKVVFIDEKAAASASSSSVKREKSKPDPKYPAANFEPKVIYP